MTLYKSDDVPRTDQDEQEESVSELLLVKEGVSENGTTESKAQDEENTHTVEKKKALPPVSVSMIEETDASEASFRRYRRISYLQLFCLAVNWGGNLEVVGPSLRDLKDRVGINYEEISRSLAGLSAGVVIGAFLAGIIYNLWPKNRDLFAMIGFISIGTTTILIPWSSSLAGIAVLFFLSGVSQGFLEIGLPTMCFYVWGDEADTPMYVLFFGFGLGSILSPQIVSPFLSPTQTDDVTGVAPTQATETDYITGNQSVTYMNNSVLHASSPDMSRVEIPFAILGGISLLMAVVLLCSHIIGPPDGFPVRVKSKLNLSMCSPAACAYGDRRKGSFLLVFLFIFYFLTVGTERASAMFMFSFATDKDKNPIDKSLGTVLNTVFWASFTVANLVLIIATNLISVNKVLGFICALALFSTALLAALAYDDNTAMWVGFILLGAALVTYPAGMAWANVFLQVNSMGVLVFVMGSQLGALVFQYLSGLLFELYGPQAFVYFLCAVGLLVAINGAVLIIGVRVCGCDPSPKIKDIEKDLELVVSSEGFIEKQNA